MPSNYEAKGLRLDSAAWTQREAAATIRRLVEALDR